MRFPKGAIVFRACDKTADDVNAVYRAGPPILVRNSAEWPLAPCDQT